MIPVHSKELAVFEPNQLTIVVLLTLSFRAWESNEVLAH